METNATTSSSPVVVLLQKLLDSNPFASLPPRAPVAAVPNAAAAPDFPRAIGDTMAGMLALAKADTEGHNVRLARPSEDLPFPCATGPEMSQIVVAFNCEHQSQRSMPGQDDWAPGGRLGLRAVTVQAKHHPDGGVHIHLGLVLPIRAVKAESLNEDGYTVVSLGQNGYMRAKRCWPAGFYRDGYLKQTLGLATMFQVISQMQTSGGYFDDMVGFPGAQDYLRAALPSLGEYLSAIGADQLERQNRGRKV